MPLHVGDLEVGAQLQVGDLEVGAQLHVGDLDVGAQLQLGDLEVGVQRRRLRLLLAAAQVLQSVLEMLVDLFSLFVGL